MTEFSNMHGHHHGYETQSMFAWTCVLHIILIVAEIIGGLIGDASLVLADAAHNAGDMLSIGLSWLGFYMLKKKTKNPRYSYGFRRSTIWLALINVMFLVVSFFLIGGHIIWSFQCQQHANPHMMMMMACFGLCVNGISAILFYRSKEFHDLNIKSTFFHLLVDAASCVVMLFVGLTIEYMHWFWVDPISAVFLLIFMWVTGWSLVKESVDLAFDAVPHEVNLIKLTHFLNHYAGVLSVHDLHIWRISTQEIAMTAHLVVPDPIWTDQDRETMIRALQTEFNIHHVTLQIERNADFCEHDCQGERDLKKYHGEADQTNPLPD